MGNWKVIKYLQGNTGARDGSLEDEEYDNYGDEDYDHEDDQDYNNDDENYGRGLLDDDYEWWRLRDILFPFGIGGWAKKCAVLQTLVDRSLSCYVLQTIGSGYLQYLYCRLLLHCYWIWMNYAILKFCLQNANGMFIICNMCIIWPIWSYEFHVPIIWNLGRLKNSHLLA